MKKLSKLSLLGEKDLLSKAELRQLVGARNTCTGTKSPCKGSCDLPGESCVWDQVRECHCERNLAYTGYTYY